MFRWNNKHLSSVACVKNCSNASIYYDALGARTYREKAAKTIHTSSFFCRRKTDRSNIKTTQKHKLHTSCAFSPAGNPVLQLHARISYRANIAWRRISALPSASRRKKHRERYETREAVESRSGGKTSISLFFFYFPGTPIFHLAFSHVVPYRCHVLAGIYCFFFAMLRDARSAIAHVDAAWRSVHPESRESAVRTCVRCVWCKLHARLVYRPMPAIDRRLGRGTRPTRAAR